MTERIDPNFETDWSDPLATEKRDLMTNTWDDSCMIGTKYVGLRGQVAYWREDVDPRWLPEFDEWVKRNVAPYYSGVTSNSNPHEDLISRLREYADKVYVKGAVADTLREAADALEEL